MLIFIENTPRSYAWGSKNALPDMLGVAPTGEPQAELWLGTHPGSPAQLAKANPDKRTLIDLVQSDPECYGYEGGPLPFLLKVLAIEGPLSLQVHPDLTQAAAGFAAEEAAGVPADARERNYGDPNHKPELLVALSEVTALSGFRELGEARRELLVLAAALRHSHVAGEEPVTAQQRDGRDVAARDVAALDVAALEAAADRLTGDDAGAVRRDFLQWVFSEDPAVAAALAALAAACEAVQGDDLDPARLASLTRLVAAYPGDPGLLVSLLLHLVRLAPGEALYLPARQLHAYLGGIGVEVMAASDNVLRAGLTKKYVDVAELCRVVDTDGIPAPRFPCEPQGPGLVAWRPGVPDFQLLRARLHVPEEGGIGELMAGSAAGEVEVSASQPLVLVVTSGRVRVERTGMDLAEVVSAKRGQSLYVSAGDPIRLTGEGEVFIATVGAAHTA